MKTSRNRLWVVCAGLIPLLPLALAGYGVFRLTQPVQATGPTIGAQARSADLERHVRVLSTEFANRSHDNALQLDGAARYIDSSSMRWV